jgi:peptide/nickel transport system permease protein
VLRFIIRRLLLAVVVMWLVSTGTFLLFFIAPGNPAKTIAGPKAPPQTVEIVKHRLGLDDPVIVQYGHFLGRLLHGDLGYSFFSNASVGSILAGGLQATISLVLGASVLWLVVGVTVGVLSATRARGVMDRAATVFVLGGISMPTFVLGLTLSFIFFFKFEQWGLPYLQAGGPAPDITTDPAFWLNRMILPWITLATVQAATYSRLTRGSLLDVLGEDYIRTARSKGLTERRVIYRHGLRSALTPVLTQFGVDIGALLGGVVVTEQVFGLQGIGQLTLQASTNGDLPVIIGVVLLVAAIVTVANLIVDISYSFLDPRVRLS